MYTLKDNAASDFANVTPVEWIGYAEQADPMNCVLAAQFDFVVVEDGQVVDEGHGVGVGPGEF